MTSEAVECQRKPVTLADLRRRVRNLCRGRHPSDLYMDVLQETLLCGVEKKIPAKDLTRWAIVACYHHMMNMVRALGARRTREQRYAKGGPARMVDDDWRAAQGEKVKDGIKKYWQKRKPAQPGSLREARGDRTQSEAAKLLGVSVRTYGNWEAGKHCSNEQIERARAALASATKNAAPATPR